MFGLFKKVEINMEKINNFCDWFISNNEQIIESVLKSKEDGLAMMRYLNIVESELAKVYRDYYKGEIFFGYGPIPKTNKWALDLSHFNKKPLIKATSLIQERLNKELSDKWIVRINK